MHPIELTWLPNRFEGLLNVLYPVTIALPSILVAIGLISFFSSSLRKAVNDRVSWIVGLTIWPALVLLIPTVILTFSGDQRQESINLRYDKISAEIKDRYGATFSGDQLYDLQWPEEKPSGDFKVFGSFDDRKQTEGANFESRKVYLVWADGKLNLSQSTDGESFTELKNEG